MKITVDIPAIYGYIFLVNNIHGQVENPEKPLSRNHILCASQGVFTVIWLLFDLREDKKLAILIRPANMV